ncbi:MAG: hypothetical protein WBD20_27135 [Pirellulaceae bacterium]
MVLCLVLLGRGSLTAFAQDVAPEIVLRKMATALDALDATALSELVAEVPDEKTGSSILLAVKVIQQASRTAQDATGKVDSENESSALSHLRGRALNLSAAEVTPELLSLSKQMRQSILRATLGGQVSEIEKLKACVSESQLPKQINDELLRFASAATELVSSFRDSPISFALALSNSQKTQSDLTEDATYEFLGEYRAADKQTQDVLQRTRAAGDNHYSLMVAKEQERAKLITAYTDMYNAYIAGEKSKLEMIQQMQEIQSKALDLKEKRALMYWALKKLRADNFQAEYDKRVAENKTQTAQRSQTTAADISAVWPSLFSHRELRTDSESLRKNLAAYSPSNSGPVSICLVKCTGDIARLLRLLNNDLQGIPIAQRAELQKYLRKLKAELNQPYSQNSYIANLNNSGAETLVAKNNAESIGGKNDAANLSINLSADDTVLASFALYRSLSQSIVIAGNQKDLQTLKGLAATIRNSNLLISEHKKRLAELGSKAFQGVVSGKDVDAIESPEQVLQMIAGVSSTLSPSSYDVPANVSDEAFQILLASTLE